jgi:hypothetical protein
LVYVHNRVPRTAERPEAESTANSVEAVLAGDATPLLRGHLMLGFREQANPFAAAGGRKYQGLVFGGSLVRTLGLVSRVTLSGTRTALLSAFEGNGFYVTNHVQADGAVGLPFGLLFDGAVGYRWNHYRTVASEIGRPRADTIFDWSVGVRRALHGWGSIGASYQRQLRRSNIDRFDTTADRLILQLDVNVLSPMVN